MRRWRSRGSFLRRSQCISLMACWIVWVRTWRSAASSPALRLFSNIVSNSCRSVSQFNSNCAPRLRPHQYCVQDAGGAGCGHRAAERIKEIGQVGKRELHEVAAAEGGTEFVKHSVAACDHDVAAVRAHVGARGRYSSRQFDASNYRAGREAINQDRGTAGVRDIELRAIRGDKEVHGRERALAQFDPLYRRLVRNLKWKAQDLRAEARCWRGDGGG